MGVVFPDVGAGFNRSDNEKAMVFDARLSVKSAAVVRVHLVVDGW